MTNNKKPISLTKVSSDVADASGKEFIFRITPTNQMDGDSSAVIDDLMDAAKVDFPTLTNKDIKPDIFVTGRLSSIWGVQFKANIELDDMPKGYKESLEQITL